MRMSQKTKDLLFLVVGVAFISWMSGFMVALDGCVKPLVRAVCGYP